MRTLSVVTTILFWCFAFGMRLDGQESRPAPQSTPTTVHLKFPPEEPVRYRYEAVNKSFLSTGESGIAIESSQIWEFELRRRTVRDDRSTEVEVRFTRGIGRVTTPQTKLEFDTATAPERDSPLFAEAGRLRLLVKEPSVALLDGCGRMVSLKAPNAYYRTDHHATGDLLEVLPAAFGGLRKAMIAIGDAWPSDYETEFIHEKLTHCIATKITAIDEQMITLEETGDVALGEAHDHGDEEKDGAIADPHEGANVEESKITGVTKISRGDLLPIEASRSESWVISSHVVGSEATQRWNVTSKWRLERVFEAPTSQPSKN